MIRSLLAAAMFSVSVPALAQSDATLPDPNDRSDTVTLALGGAYVPDYEGSDDYEFTPFGAIRGRLGGFSFATRGTYLYVDLLRRPESGVDFDFGPIVGVRRERLNKVEDDFVQLFGKRKTAVEVGGFAGVSFHGLTNPYDTLSLRIDVVHDVANAHQSTVVTPAIDFGTPLSRTTYVGASLSADFIANKYADYYYRTPLVTIGPNTLLANNPDGGMKNWRLGALVNQSITGDLTGGLSIFAGANYSRIVGDIADSPIVSDRGSRSQWQVATGLAYTF
jgi:outer membrane scaffolding protein for murein synthesis (MipA/OmpV family)